MYAYFALILVSMSENPALFHRFNSACIEQFFRSIPNIYFNLIMEIMLKRNVIFVMSHYRKHYCKLHFHESSRLNSDMININIPITIVRNLINTANKS